MGLVKKSKRSEDRLLVEKLVERDPQSWQEFMNRFYGFICRRIYFTSNEFRFVLSQPEVEDISSEVLKALVANDMASLRNFQGTSTLETWMCVVVRRITIRCLDKRPKDRGTGNEIDDAVESRSPQAVSDLIQKEELAQVGYLIEKLKDSDRTVLQLFYFDELSYKEIAQQMSMPVNSVGSKLVRAQQRLRKLAQESRA